MGFRLPIIRKSTQVTSKSGEVPKSVLVFSVEKGRPSKKQKTVKDVLKTFLKDKTISRARIVSEGTNGDGFTISKTVGEIEGTHDELFDEAEVAAVAEDKEAHLFEIDPSQVNPDIDMELKPQGKPPPYQEKSLSKMFGNVCKPINGPSSLGNLIITYNDLILAPL
ncbi:hypothetical protein Ahy_A03g012645 [Arachis hypogaea]|uniref:Uncharacterized protein n=1 Tax=Arachis hypogaea TaxID=3818 RepID=A0A445DTV3_ARAHY|nr:hypothetical protein Ahy_A03g012645 [Arachis hypogaea]